MNTAAGRWPVKYLPKVLLGYVMERLLTGQTGDQAVPVSSPWDAWWAGYRAALPVERAGLRPIPPARACAGCTLQARALAGQGPAHPDDTGQTRRSCSCLLEWAVRMRAPGDTAGWPPLALTLALLKPGAPRHQITAELARNYDILSTGERRLTTADTRRLYPEAYGADYVAARDRYLTSEPVQILVLRTRPGGAAEPGEQVKAQIRAAVGADRLHNHLHMPDNPGEALADIAHLAGPNVLADLYERHERGRAADRLAFYRTALGIGGPHPHRRPDHRPSPDRPDSP